MTDLATIRRFLLAQDSACTPHPVFVVQRRVRDTGYDPDYTDDICWIDSDGTELTKDTEPDNSELWTFQRLEELYDEGEEAPDGWTRTGFRDRWEYVQPFFTRQGAEDYIASERHNLGLARVVVESAHRNPEWQAIRALLMAQPLSERFLINAQECEDAQADLEPGIGRTALRSRAVVYRDAARMAREAGL